MIGIDALDSVTLAKFETELPNLRMLKQRSPALRLTSVYPPDSHTCWASIYTGLNPAKHGIVQFIDPLDKASAMATEMLPGSRVHILPDYAGHDRVLVVERREGFGTGTACG